MKNTEKLHNWIQITGMTAVVVSLIFVGLQLRQSHQIAIAAQYQARLDSASSHYASILQCPSGLNVIGSDMKTELLTNEELPQEFRNWILNQPDDELAFRMIGALISLKSYDNVYFQYQSGFLSDEAWAALRTQFKIVLADSRTWIKSIYLKNPEAWRESYRGLIEELLLEIESAS